MKPLISHTEEMFTATAAVAAAPIEPTMAVSASVDIEIKKLLQMDGQASLTTVWVTWRSPSSRMEEGASAALRELAAARLPGFSKS